jgi:hypothetical protein
VCNARQNAELYPTGHPREHGGSHLATHNVVRNDTGKSSNVRDLEDRLSRALGSTTTIQERGKERGQFRISCASFDELDRIIETLTK